MLAIYKREMKAYFTTMIGYIFIAVSLFLIGLGFFSYNLYQGYPYFSYTVQGCTLVLLVSIPFLTMRAMSEERKSKTEQLFLTSPVSLTSVVLGKFIAAFTVFAIPCAISCIYPLVLRRYGSVPLGEAYIAMLGFVFYGAACIAIGLFFSSVVTNQVVAAILTFIALLLGYLMASIIALFNSNSKIASDILGIYDLSTPLNYMTNGVIDLSAIFYYVTITALFIFLTVQSIQKRRCTITSANFAKSSFSIIGIIAAIVVFIGANVAVKQIPDRYTSFDFSYNKIFSISDSTEEFLDSLQGDVTVYVLYSKDGYDEYVSKMLEKYEIESEHVKVEYIDPMEYPRFYLQYTDTTPEEGSLIVVSGAYSKVIQYSYLYEYDYSNYYYTGEVEISGFAGEGQVNSAIDFVLNGTLSSVYVLTGHGEDELDETYYETFDLAGAKCESVNLDNYDSIPGSISGIIINGAKEDLSSADVEKLYKYLDNGGKILITLAHMENETPNLDELLEYMDIMVTAGEVLENDPNYYLDQPNMLLPEITDSKYTGNLPDFAVLPDAVGMIVNDYSEYVSYDKFMTTTRDAFLKVNYKETGILNEEEGDYEDSFTVGVEAKRQEIDEDGIVTNPVMVVFASSAMFTSEMDALVNNSNIILFSNIVSSFVEESNDSFASTKLLNLPFLNIDSSARNVIIVITMLIIPLCILAYGIYICIKRRRN